MVETSKNKQLISKYSGDYNVRLGQRLNIQICMETIRIVYCLVNMKE
jgi:hypothetical protein